MRNQETTDVLANDVRLDVHSLANGERAERGVLEGVLYQRYLNGGGRGKLVDREADSVDRERPMGNDEISQLGIDGQVDDRGVGASFDLSHSRNAIDVTEDKVSTEPAVGAQRALEVHSSTLSPLADRGTSER